MSTGQRPARCDRAFRWAVVVAALASGSILTAVTAYAQTASLVSMQKQTSEKEASAWAVATKQTALGANQLSGSVLVARQQLVTAIGALSMTDRLRGAMLSFSPRVGQPASIKCTAQQNGALQVSAEQQQKRDASRLMGSFASSRVGSKAAASREALSTHRTYYCSVSEAQRGMCTLLPNGMQSWDTNYAGAFSERTLAPEAELAAYAYISVVSDTRAEAFTDCVTTGCAAAQAAHLSAAAMSSMAASSLINQATERRMPMITGQ